MQRKLLPEKYSFQHRVAQYKARQKPRILPLKLLLVVVKALKSSLKRQK